MTRLHHLASAVAVVLTTAALLAPSAQARPTAASGGGAVAIDRHAHDTPLANPVSIPTTQGAAAGARSRTATAEGTARTGTRCSRAPRAAR